jgi:Fic family protein
MTRTFKIVPTDLLAQFSLGFAPSVQHDFEQLTDSALSADTFSFYTSVSAVFSSKIEGEDITLDAFVKHKRLGVAYQPDYTRKIDDLYNAYLFVQQNRLSAANLLAAHAELTKHILQPELQGAFRSTNMFVVADDGKIEYVAAIPAQVPVEMEKLYNDIGQLVNTALSFEETFFYAAMLHLLLVKIHPFSDGNGRTARLLEKWFLAEKLGEQAWLVPSERFYYNHHATYYNSIRKLGLEYEALNYSEALPFLQLLPMSLNYKEKINIKYV